MGLQKNLDRIRIRRVAFMREEENTKPPPPPPQKVESSPEPEPEPLPRVDLGNRTSGLFGGLPGQLPARPRQVREKSATPASGLHRGSRGHGRGLRTTAIPGRRRSVRNGLSTTADAILMTVINHQTIMQRTTTI